MHTQRFFTRNSEQAGIDMLRYCQHARATLIAQLPVPDADDQEAVDAYLQARREIQWMDYRELTLALRHVA